MTRTERQVVAAEFKRRRRALGWTQQDLATCAGVSLPTVSRLERVTESKPMVALADRKTAAGRPAGPSGQVIRALAGALGCTEQELLEGDVVVARRRRAVQ